MFTGLRESPNASHPFACTLAVEHSVLLVGLVLGHYGRLEFILKLSLINKPTLCQTTTACANMVSITISSSGRLPFAQRLPITIDIAPDATVASVKQAVANEFPEVGVV